VFRIYWLAGPLINVPLLGTGQLLLLDRDRAWPYWWAVRIRRWTVLLITLGVMIVAGDSVAIRVGNGELFSLLLAAGISVMYVGFLATTGSRRSSTAPTGAGPDGRRRRGA
jgi:hypothetical protein